MLWNSNLAPPLCVKTCSRVRALGPPHQSPSLARSVESLLFQTRTHFPASQARVRHCLSSSLLEHLLSSKNVPLRAYICIACLGVKFLANQMGTPSFPGKGGQPPAITCDQWSLFCPQGYLASQPTDIYWAPIMSQALCQALEVQPWNHW